MLPSLAESWTPGPDGRSLTVKLRPHITFHDGSPANAEAIASVFPGALKAFLGPLVSVLESVKTSGPDSVTITFREKTPFLIETLEAPIQKPNGVGTGAFKTSEKATTELISNDDYYLGAPALKRVHVETFASIRTAWAEMLRDKIDMLWEVGPEALASMQNSSTVLPLYLHTTLSIRDDHEPPRVGARVGCRAPRAQPGRGSGGDRTQRAERLRHRVERTGVAQALGIQGGLAEVRLRSRGGYAGARAATQVDLPDAPGLSLRADRHHR
jgi:hypothetical protein